ncbi:MAG: TusE/DsrC/DsvC family sulfur relay protein [Longimicrobiales bacterium]|nr:TusE/DsrC/DsvC family sulfur relay protein [Longimicrobiales bacterium]
MATERGTLNKTLSLKGKDYRVNHEGLLADPDDWDEDFAQEMAERAGIEGGLNERQWEVILFIRRFWEERGSCPTVFQTCRILGLHLTGFHFLFPSGYQRGACKLAGISYKAGRSEEVLRTTELAQKSYRIDIWGFLLDPDEWDDRFALLKAHEMKVPGGLTNKHWRVLRFLRQEYFRLGRVPTLHQSCEAIGIDLEELEGLFPDGYHRGAVKIAGLPAEL